MLLRKVITLVLRSRRDVRNAAVLFGLMFIAAALEAVAVGVIMPFVALVQNPAFASTSRALSFARNMSGARSDMGFVYAFSAGVVGLFVFKNVFLTFVQWLQQRFIAGRHLVLSKVLVERYLGSRYTFHLQHNSAELIQNVIMQVYLITHHVLVSLFTIAVEGLTILVILVAMVAMEPLLVPLVGAVTGVVALSLYRAIQRQTLEEGRRLKATQGEMIRSLQQALGGIKEVQVVGAERFFVDTFARPTVEWGDSGAKHGLMMVLPRYVLESLGIVALVTITVGMLARGRPPGAVLPVLGVLAIAAVRLLPSVSRILACMTDTRHSSPAVEAVYDVLVPSDDFRSLPDSEPEPVAFDRELRFVDVEYRYPGAARASLENVSLTIRRGESIAFVGGSGAGKTTIADLLIGLLEPTAGHIEVDGKRLEGDRLRGWRRRIGYIPQQVYLCDDSVLRNVAFGVEDAKIDRARVERAVDAARLSELVATMPEGLDTFVGERGVRISGGQRQRIGIARALYLDPEVLVLDEATSALDGKTEHEIVEAIERIRSERTAIIIAHRLSTVRGCDRLVFLSEGNVVQVGTWHELYEQNADFKHLVNLAEGEPGGGAISASA